MIAPRPLDLPAQLGPYVLREALGRGGMGVVHRGIDPRLDRAVAIKIMIPDGTAVDAVGVKRFLREMRAQASLSHPNIVKIFDVGTDGGFQYFVMELLAGHTLKAQIEEEHALSRERVLSIGIAMGQALVEMHTKHMIHRDIKPQNIFIRRDGRPILMDLGLVRIATATVLTEAGSIVGTPRYLAPEVILGTTADTRSDLYQLGLVLYEAATGRVPYDAPDARLLIPQILAGKLTSPGEQNPVIGPELDAVIRRMLAPEREARPRSAREIVTALEDLSRAGDDALATRPATGGGQGARKSSGRYGRTSSGVSHFGDTPGVSFGSVPARLRSLPATGAGLSILALLLLGIALHHRTSTPSIKASAIPSSPSDTAALQADSERSLTGQWHRFLNYLPTLKLGGGVARHALAAIRKQSLVDFGPRTESWVYWMELSRWLANPRGSWPPRELAPAIDLFAGNSGLQQQEDEEFVRRLDSDVTPSVVSQIFGLIESAPADGQLWLTLGRVLERDGDSQGALTAYATALDHLRGREMWARSRWVWAGLARALMLTPGHDLEKEWPTYFAGQRTQQRFAWDGLRDALVSSHVDTQIYRRLLAPFVEKPVDSTWPFVLMGELNERGILGARRDPDQALAVWDRGLRKLPKDPDLLECLMCFHLARGDVISAKAVIGRLVPDRGWRDLLDLLTVPPPTVPVVGALHAGGSAIVTEHWRALAPLRMLEEGRVREAIKQVSIEADERVRRFDVGWDLAISTLDPEIIAAGDTDTQWSSRARERLLGHEFLWRPWALASGALASARGVTTMQRFLDRRRAWDRDQVPLRVIEALWKSRRHQDSEALATLEAITPAFAPTLDESGAIAEILSRPIWAEALGSREAAPAAARARRFHLSKLPDPASDYCAKLVAGDLPGAAAAAERAFRLQPEAPIWGLVGVWDAARRNDGPALASRIAIARVSFRFEMFGLWPLRELDAIERRARDGTH